MDAETLEALQFAAMVALHKQLSESAEVVLTPQDFENWDQSIAEKNALTLDYDPETGNVSLRHVKPVSDA
jgi:predicted DNA-binding transcriptional regulator YafY